MNTMQVPLDGRKTRERQTEKTKYETWARQTKAIEQAKRRTLRSLWSKSRIENWDIGLHFKVWNYKSFRLAFKYCNKFTENQQKIAVATVFVLNTTIPILFVGIAARARRRHQCDKWHQRKNTLHTILLLVLPVRRMTEIFYWKSILYFGIPLIEYSKIQTTLKYVCRILLNVCENVLNNGIFKYIRKRRDVERCSKRTSGSMCASTFMDDAQNLIGFNQSFGTREISVCITHFVQ